MDLLMDLMPQKPKSFKDVILGLFLSIGGGFFFAYLNGYGWQPALIGGGIAFVILVLLPSLVINLVYYWRRDKG